MTESAEYRPAGERTQVRRHPPRGHYDRATINAILDEGFVAHLGFARDGQPYVIPTSYARDGDRLLIHGSAGSRLMMTLDEPIDVCVTVTLVDGIVIARAAFNQSINYRSVVVLGQARTLTDPAEKLDALVTMSERLVPDCWSSLRPPSKKELAATTIAELSLTEASAKIRSGPPVDDEDDYALPTWAGVIPLSTEFGEPVPDPRNLPGLDVPSHVVRFRRPRTRNGLPPG